MRSSTRISGIFALVAASLFTATTRAAVVLMVVDDSGTYNTQESARKTQLEAWGHTVTNVWDNAAQGTIDSAVAAADVVYVPSTIDDWELLYKLRTAAKGVVTETPGLDQEFGFATGDGYTQNWSQLENVDNSHIVTSGVAGGTLTIVSSNQSLGLNANTIATGMQTLATLNFGNMTLGVMESGGTLANTYNGNSTASGRRVRLPWALVTFNTLNSNGLSILESSIAWAAGSDLLLHLKLDETSGTTANDSSNYDCDGTVVGTASWIAARRHNGFDFNGSTKIEVNSLLGSPASFTLACWARIDATDSSGAEGVSVGDYILLRPHDVTNGVALAHFHYGGNAYRTVAATKSYVARGWHHFAATFDDSADSLKLYVDGVLINTTSTTSSVSWSGLGTKTRIGSHGNTNTNLDMDGAIDDVRVYRRALSQSEIASVFGLVGHWKLTETSGTSAADSSGKALNGAYTGGPALAQAGPYQGPGQYAVSLDGADDRVDGPVSTSYAFADGFSIAGWVRLNAHVASAAMLQNGSTTQNCELGFSGTGQVTVAGRSTGGLQAHTSTATLPLGMWKHVVGTYDGATFRCYVDGQLVSSANNPFTLAAPSGNLTLGASPQGTAEYLNGRLQDVRLYNRAIAADEVVELYGLVGYWKLNEASGTTLADSSGLGNSGTISGTAQWTAGAYDNGHRFQYANGDDYVTIPNSTSLQDVQENDYTISYWFKPASVPPGAGFANDAIYATVTKMEGYTGSGYGNTRNFGMAHAFADGTIAQAFGTTPMAIGRWHHVAATVNRTGGVMQLYVNGLLQASSSFAANKLAHEHGTAPFRLGIGVPGSGTTRFASDGTLDDVRIYSRAISAEEVVGLAGMVGHWKFDESVGASAADSSGNSRNASFVTGAPAWIATGAYANALEFNGSNAAATSTSVPPPTEGTVSVWFRSDGAPTARQRLWGVNTDFEMWQDPDGLVSCDICTDGYQGGCITTTPMHTAGRWYHLAVVYDCDDDTYAIYLNGQPHKSGVSTWGTSPQAATNLSFGTRTGMTDFFRGALDDFRIYSRKLSAPDIYELYGLEAWYKLDETSGNVAADSTGLLNDATIAGNPSLGVTANGAPSQGTAFAFNGSNYIQASGLFELAPSVSAAAWVRLDNVDSNGAEVISMGDHFRLRLQSGANGAAAAYHNGSAYVTATASRYILSTGWHHFAAVLRAGDTLKLYIDGNEAASVPVNGSISYSGLGSNTRMASHGNAGTTTDLTGRMDDVRVYDRAIKPEEVFQLYRGSRINGIKVLKWVETR